MMLLLLLLLLFVVIVVVVFFLPIKMFYRTLLSSVLESLLDLLRLGHWRHLFKRRTEVTFC